MASRQTIARLSDRIEALAEAPLRENRKTHYVCVGGTRAEWDACADRQIKELISSGKARNDDNFFIIYWEGMPCAGDRAACSAQACRGNSSDDQ
jgi:hypothetical protein